MEKFVYNPISDKDYIGILTILDYEASTRQCISNALICTKDRTNCKIIVDLALKVGINEYRFAEFNVSDDGRILWSSSKYIKPCDDIVKLANSFIREQRDILPNSMLPRTMQLAILDCKSIP